MGWDRYQLGQPAVEVLAQAPLLNVQSGHSNGSFGNRKSRNSRNIKALQLSSFPKWNGVKQNESCIQVVASSGWDGALLCGKGTMSGNQKLYYHALFTPKFVLECLAVVGLICVCFLVCAGRLLFWFGCLSQVNPVTGTLTLLWLCWSKDCHGLSKKILTIECAFLSQVSRTQ